MVWPTFQPQPVNVMVATDIYFLELKPNKTHFEIIESKFGQPSNGRVFREDNLGLKDKDHNRREIGDFGLGKHSIQFFFSGSCFYLLAPYFRIQHHFDGIFSLVKRIRRNSPLDNMFLSISIEVFLEKRYYETCEANAEYR